MKSNHTTENPKLLTILTAAIFVFTSIVFILYDVCVARRQKIVMNRALESGAIVSSLFPAEVRQKLYEEQQAKIVKEKKRSNFQTSATGGAASGAPVSCDDETTLAISNQIAREYPECTVFFADLKG